MQVGTMRMWLVALALWGTSPWVAADLISPRVYNSLLRRAVRDGQVNYVALASQRDELDRYLTALSSVDPEDGPPQAQMAFWINAYNAATLQLVLDHYPIRRSSALGLLYPENSIRQIAQAWEIGGVQVGDERFTLNQIAHEILRKRFADPRVLFAMASAARGSPALLDEAYVADQLEAQLDAAARSFLRDSEHGFRLDPSGSTVWLSRIFAWYGRDFVAGFSRGPFSVGPRHSEQEAAVLNFIQPLLPPEQQAALKGGDFTVAYLPYDWSLNGL